MYNSCRELFSEDQSMILSVDACKEMLLRAGKGTVKHLSTKQLGVQSAENASR